jgi:hypothetical protein
MFVRPGSSVKTVLAADEPQLATTKDSAKVLVTVTLE